jgi:outer membrane biosynthesis protein TonB
MKVLGHSRDTRPLSALERRPIHPDMVIGGIVAVLVAHIALPILVKLVTTALGATIADAGPQQSFIEEHVVEARFVQKGVKLDPKKLPDRIVPRKSTTPIDDSTVVSKNMNPEPPEKREKPPKDAEKNELENIGDRAQLYAEIQKEMEKEGEEDGVEGGTETAQTGDLYAGQLYNFFRKNWTIPNTISDPTKFNATVDIDISRDMHVTGFKIARGSGDALFDQSVEDLFNKLRSENLELPEPPPDAEHRYRGRSITITFSGKKR